MAMPEAPAFNGQHPASLVVVSADDMATEPKLGDAMTMPGMSTFGYFTDKSGTSMGLIGSST